MHEIEVMDRMPATKEIVFDEVERSGFIERWLPAGADPRRVVRVLPDECRAVWDGRQGGDYAGSVEVRDSGAGASEVTVRVTMDDRVPDPRTGPVLAADVTESLRDLYRAVSKRVANP